ncbi:MAG: Low affinity iron permease [Planctomycetota bacterium]|nr:Low affinity iron permease [Planctomycetota bacterium]
MKESPSPGTPGKNGVNGAHQMNGTRNPTGTMTSALETPSTQKPRTFWTSETFTAWAGSPFALYGAAALVVAWLAVGPLCGYSDTWQLTINTGTSVITFLMVFLIQRTQNRDTRAIHLKLNELIAAVEGASNRLINAEDLDDEAMRSIYERFQELAVTMQAEGPSCRASSVEEVPLPDEAAIGVNKSTN